MNGHIGSTFIGQSTPSWESQEWMGGIISFVLICLMLSLFLMQMAIFNYLVYWLKKPSIHGPDSHNLLSLSLCKEFELSFSQERKWVHWSYCSLLEHPLWLSQPHINDPGGCFPPLVFSVGGVGHQLVDSSELWTAHNRKLTLLRLFDQSRPHT